MHFKPAYITLAAFLFGLGLLLVLGITHLTRGETGVLCMIAGAAVYRLHGLYVRVSSHHYADARLTTAASRWYREG